MLKDKVLKAKKSSKEIEEKLPREDEEEKMRGAKACYSSLYKTSVKAAVYVLFILMVEIFCLSILTIAAIFAGNIYTRSENDLRKKVYESQAEEKIHDLLQFIGKKEYENMDAFAREAHMTRVSIVNTKDKKEVYTYTVKAEDREKSQDYQWQQKWSVSNDSIGRIYGGRTSPNDKEVQILDVSVTIQESGLNNSRDFYIATGIHILYLLKYWIYVIAFAAGLLALASFVYLMVASGRRMGERKILPGWGTAFPFDLLTFLMGIVVVFSLEIIFGMVWDIGYNTLAVLAGYGFLSLLCLTMGLGWCMSLALRIKLGILFKNTLIYKAFFACLRLIKKCCRLLLKTVCVLPSMWRLTIMVLGISSVEFIFAMAYSWGTLFFWFLLEKMILLPFIFYVGWMLLQLKRGGEVMAEGDLDYRISEEHLRGDFKEHAHHLNNIAKGLSFALEEKMKSERMKMELITNVSHDIKTPLTSIINYSDLIGKEHSENETINNYAEVLYRQSKRLKRLIDDLVEASKVSTGNLEIIMSPCQVGVILTQAVGEFEQRMKEQRLELICRQPAEEIYIMADGRRIWRVFDNLLNNVCKYAQPDTRVYLGLIRQGSEAVITLKNTSKDALNLTADEFLERFTRGDLSRNTEGTGLGLSIAKSLTELQKGSLTLSIDGDLFKVELRFLII